MQINQSNHLDVRFGRLNGLSTVFERVASCVFVYHSKSAAGLSPDSESESSWNKPFSRK